MHEMLYLSQMLSGTHMEADSGKEETGITRQLGAIVFADMMGYTALMQQDEQRAKLLRDRMRDILNSSIPAYGGKIIQYYGDGMLCVFGSVAQSVHCMIDVQKLLQEDPRVPLRIGIHSGDVCYDVHGAYGDCVNVASRIEALSVPGAVLVSDKVYDEIKNQTSISVTSLGNFNLKNVKRPVEVYAVTNDGLIVPELRGTGSAQETDYSIAVLPFRNLSADPDNEYLSDGISEEILNALSKVAGLRVCSRTSTFVYKGQHEDVRQIGQKLGVAAVLEGSVRRGGNKVRISAQLVNTRDGYQIFSEVFDGDLDDIFQVQDEIASRIVRRMQEQYPGGERSKDDSTHTNVVHVVNAPTGNLEAYHLYLKGRYHWNRSNPEDIRKAATAFEKAIHLDPSFASAYCMLSHCFSFMGSAGMMPYAEAFSKAKDCTLRAIEIDPNHAESHLALGSIKFMQQWDFAGAEVSMQKAASLGLNSALFNQLYGMLLIALGRHVDAVDRIEVALKQEPLSIPLICQLGDAYAFARRYDDALAQYEKALEMDPNFRRAYEGIGFVYLAKADYAKAVVNLEIYQRLIGNPMKGLSGLGYAYALAGMHDKALECLEKTQQRQLSEPGINLDVDHALIYAGLGDYDKTYEHLYRMYEQRSNVVCLGMIYCLLV